MFRPWEDNHKKKKKYTHFEFKEQQLILQVYERVRSEIGTYGAKLRTSELTNASIRTVTRIVTKKPKKKTVRNSSKFKKIDNFTQDVIIRIVEDFYTKNMSPTVQMIYEELTKDGAVFPYSCSHLGKYIKSIGFKHRILDARKKIMDSPRLLHMRDDYLSKINKFRQDGRNIIYLDETWYDTHDVTKKGWQMDDKICTLNVPASRGKRIIILHAGSASGWVNGALLLSAKNMSNCSADYHQDMNACLFEKWFEDQLLPNITEGSVIVMDNAPYHSRQKELIPCSNTRKGDIQMFLSKHNISYPEKATKDALLKIIKLHTFNKTYFIEEMAKMKNCEVLRLPPYYCTLNPIELMWSSLKRYIRRHNSDPKFSEGVLQLIRESITLTNDKWGNCCSHVQRLEHEMSRGYTHPSVIINLTDEDSDDDNEDSDDDV